MSLKKKRKIEAVQREDPGINVRKQEHTDSFKVLQNYIVEYEKSHVAFLSFGIANFLPLNPGLHVNGLGPISLPLTENDCRRITSIATKSPYGLGEKTLVDVKVRRTWQLDPDQFTLENSNFTTLITTRLLKRILFDLKCPKNANVDSELYKLLLYEKGDHFKSHRDTEKFDGMFATLVIQLPCKYTGGTMITYHENLKNELVLVKDSDKVVYYSAHYADCRHEVKPIESGCRLVLVYSLFMKAPLVKPVISRRVVRKVASGLSAIYDSMMLHKDDGDVTNQQGQTLLMLRHQYSQESLKKGVYAMKGSDLYLVSLFMEAEKRLHDKPLLMYFTEISKHVTEYGDHERTRRFELEHERNRINWEKSYSDIETEAEPESSGEFICYGQIDDDSPGYNASRFIKMNGDPVTFSPIKLNQDQGLKVMNASQTNFQWGDFVDEEIQGPTGNEGSLRIRSYRRYGLIFWPAEFTKLHFFRNSTKEFCLWAVNEIKNGNEDMVAPYVREYFGMCVKKNLNRTFLYDSCSEYEPFIACIIELNDVELFRKFMSSFLKVKRDCSLDSSLRNEIHGISQIPKGMSKMVCRFPWNEIDITVLELMQECSILQLPLWVTIADDLILVDNAAGTVLIERVVGRAVSYVSENCDWWQFTEMNHLDRSIFHYQINVQKVKVLVSVYWLNCKYSSICYTDKITSMLTDGTCDHFLCLLEMEKMLWTSLESDPVFSTNVDGMLHFLNDGPAVSSATLKNELFLHWLSKLIGFLILNQRDNLPSIVTDIIKEEGMNLTGKLLASVRHNLGDEKCKSKEIFKQMTELMVEQAIELASKGILNLSQLNDCSLHSNILKFPKVSVFRMITDLLILTNQDSLLHKMLNAIRPCLNRHDALRDVVSETGVGILVKTALGKCILQERLKSLLELKEWGPPRFSWCMHHNDIPSDKSHEKAFVKFIKGKKQLFVYQGVNCVMDGRKWIYKNFLSNDAPVPAHYSADVTGGGSKKNCYIIVKKNKDHYKWKLSVYAEDMKAIEPLKTLLKENDISH